MNATRNAASGATAIPSVSSQRNEQDLLSSSLQTCQLGMSTLYLEVMLSDWQPSADCFHLPIANSFYICWDSNDGSDYERDGGRSRPSFHGRWHCQIHFQALSATHETNGVSKRGSCRAGLFFYMHSSWKKKTQLVREVTGTFESVSTNSAMDQKCWERIVLVQLPAKRILVTNGLGRFPTHSSG